VEALGLETRPSSLSICGVNGTVTSTNHVVGIKLQSRLNSYTAAIECIVTDRITGKIPTFSLRRDKFNFPRNIRLADPRFHISSDIDLLIGVDLFWNLICVGQVKFLDKHPTLQKTRLGWILAGRLDSTISTVRVHSLHASVTNAELHKHVSRAWQMDDISTQLHNYTMEENICERYFLDNVSQNSQGRYIVKLPVREQMINNIDDSRESALKRLRGIERRSSSAILFLKFNTRRFSTNIYRWDTCDAWNYPLRKKQYHFIFSTIASSKRSGKLRKSVLYSMHFAVVPAYR